MVAIATAIGKNIWSYDGKFLNYPSLWMIAIGAQGMNKSEPFKQGLKPLMDIDLANYNQYLNELNEWDGKDEKSEPSLKQMIFQDATPESLIEIFNRTKHLLCYRDEFLSKILENNRYNKGSQIEFELSVFSGGQFTVNRKSFKPILLDNPVLNQIGTIQPEISTKHLGSDSFVYNGYLSRFLFIYPERVISPYNYNSLDDNILKRYHDFISGIANFGHIGLITYSEQAKKMYADYYNSLQDKIKDSEDAFQAGIYSKLQIHVQRLALTTYVARAFEVNEGMQITDKIMSYSIECMNYFEHNALKIRDMIMKNQNPFDGMKNADLLRQLAVIYPNVKKNHRVLADVLGVDRSYVSRELGKLNK